jgi:hypothetical protein
VLWPEIDEHVLAVECGLERKRLLESDGRSTVVGDEWNALRLSVAVEAGS